MFFEKGLEMVFGKRKGNISHHPSESLEYQDLKKELDNIRAVLAMKNPFVASLLRRCRIIADTNVESACVNADGEIRINPLYLKSLSVPDRVFEYGDKVLHIAFSHPQRMRGKEEKLFDFASHATTTALLRNHGFGDGPSGTITPEAVAKFIGKKPEEIATMSVEEIYHLLQKQVKDNQNVPSKNDLSSKGSQKGQDEGKDSKKTDGDKKDENDGSNESPSEKPKKDENGKQKSRVATEEKQGTRRNEGDESSEEGNGEEHGENESSQDQGTILQEGDPEAYDPQKTPDEKEEFWKEAVRSAYVQAKLAGKLPADLDRLIDDLYKSQVDWKHVIKKEIQNGLGKNVISTWTRPSRKHPLYPGVKRLTKPTVRFLPDTSGSIGENELTQSISEAYQISKFVAFLKIYPWDAVAYDPIEVKKPRDVILHIKNIKGGGGTIIGPVLELVNDEMKKNDVVVIVSDGYIYDLGDSKTYALLARIASRASVAVFATLTENIRLPRRWKQVRIRI